MKILSKNRWRLVLKIIIVLLCILEIFLGYKFYLEKSKAKQPAVEPTQATVATTEGSSTQDENKIVKRVSPNKRFLYENGIKFKDKEYSKEEIDTAYIAHYGQIEGLLDTKVQDKINKEIKSEVLKTTKYVAQNKNIKVNSVYCYQNGNYNNVLGITASIDYQINNEYKYYTKTFNYNLKDGSTLYLKDVFTKGTDYAYLLNREITEYLIRENMDEEMISPFSGINDSTQFTVGDNYINLIFNEDENSSFNENRFITLSFDDLENVDYIYYRYEQSDKPLYANQSKIHFVSDSIKVVNKEKNLEKNGCKIYARYFQYENMKNEDLQQRINAIIINKVNEFIDNIPATEENKDKYFEISVRNAACFMDKVSISIDSYGTDKDYQTILSTYDVNTGKLLTLSDFMQNNNIYKERLINEVKNFAKSRIKDDSKITSFEALANQSTFMITQYGMQIAFNKDSSIYNPEYYAENIYIDYEKIDENVLNLFK